MTAPRSVLLVLLPCLAAARPAVRRGFSGAVITTPVGAYARYDHSLRLGDTDLWLGFFDTFLFYADAAGAQLAWRTEPAWLDLHVDAAAEPGFYVHAPDTDRTFDWRFLLSPQLDLNLIFGDVWLYSRTTGVFRHRAFREDDTFQGLTLGDERSIEQATAVLIRVTGHAGNTALWLYAEHTIGGIAGAGVRPNRPSGGAVLEGWPTAGVTLDLDAFYSFAPAPTHGPGALFAWWIDW